MQNIFFDTRILDKKSREKFYLTEELMMRRRNLSLALCLTFSMKVRGT